MKFPQIFTQIKKLHKVHGTPMKMNKMLCDVTSRVYIAEKKKCMKKLNTFEHVSSLTLKIIKSIKKKNF